MSTEASVERGAVLLLLVLSQCELEGAVAQEMDTPALLDHYIRDHRPDLAPDMCRCPNQPPCQRERAESSDFCEPCAAHLAEDRR